MNIKINVGLRLLAIGLGIATANYVPVFLALMAPFAFSWRSVLGVADAQTEELLGKVRDAAKKEVDMHLKAFNDEGEKKIAEILDKKMDAFKGIPLEKLKQVVDDMDSANKVLAELKEKQRAIEERNAGPKESFLIKKLKENWPAMQKAFKEGNKNFGFRVEDTKIDTGSFGEGVVRGFREAGVSFENLPELFILDLIQVMTGGPGSNPLTWVERNVVTQVGPPAIVEWPTAVAEGAVKPELGYSWTEGKMAAETIAAIVPVTKQAVYNYPQLEAEIRFELVRRLAQVLQNEILKGDGTPGLTGLWQIATPFAAGSFADSVPYANRYDVLVAAASQVLAQGFVPTASVVGFGAKGAMAMNKDANGAYSIPPFIAADGLTVYGLKIYGTTAFTDDEFLVMDPTKALFNWVEPITIEIGWINDDFARNMWRIRGELQGMLRVKSHETGAFVKGGFAAAIGAIDKPIA